ncbi:serine hydrolase [Synechocystis salina LEGE 06099]|uniref:serine hydrolase n=1 Tax=Synechocystis salina TaxID=945780 RepID=UPI00187FBFBB|nr:serine hydrolase [Synechocystis salina]MBE9202484.1 serine hydrolase [Synechocystis salina LEGE 06099]
MAFFQQDPALGDMAQAILESTWQTFPALQRDQIALTWLVYDAPVMVNTGGAIAANEFWQYPVRGFSYRGIERIYPASVVKLFYLVAMAEWLEGGMVKDSPELERAVRDMIVDSSNDATSLVVDTLTGTSSGPMLPPGPFETWQQQRNIVNRYFQSLGWEELQNINVNQKTWGDGYYGRERAFVGELYEQRNMLTTNAVARLLHSIIGGVAVSSTRSQQMMQLLKRDLKVAPPPPGEDNQITGFLGEALPRDAQIWSKAGWTSQVRHDCAYIEIPHQSPYLLVVFTENSALAGNRRLLPFISQAFANAY